MSAACSFSAPVPVDGRLFVDTKVASSKTAAPRQLFRITDAVAVEIAKSPHRARPAWLSVRAPGCLSTRLAGWLGVCVPVCVVQRGKSDGHRPSVPRWMFFAMRRLSVRLGAGLPGCLGVW